MKIFIKITTLLLILSFMLGLLVACTNPSDDSPEETPDDNITVKLDTATLVYDSSSSYKFIPKLAEAMATYLSSNTGKTITSSKDSSRTDVEILIGRCNRDEYKKSPDDLLFRDFFIYFENNKLSIDAVSIYGYEYALKYLNKVFSAEGLTIPKDGLHVSYDYGEGDFAEIYKNYENQNLEGAWLVNVSHRGDAKTNKNPENSIPAYQSCIDNKVDIIETDVRKTKDGFWVICHDETTAKTTNGGVVVANSTLKTLKGFYLREGDGRGSITTYKMPTLEEVIELCKGKAILNLDKISVDMYEEIYDIFDSYDAANIAMFKANTDVNNIIDWFCELISEGRTLPLFSPMSYQSHPNSLSNVVTDYKGLTSMVEAATHYTKEQLAAAYNIDKNIRIMCLTALEPTLENATYWALLQTRGYSGIMTDYPTDLQKFIHGEK